MERQYEKYSEGERAERSIFKKYGKFININGNNNYIVDKGKGQPVILIHGIAASVYSWRYVINSLSKNYRIIAIDLCGAGFSDKPDLNYNIEELCKEVLQIMSYLNIQKPILVGSSLGGEIVLNITVNYPDKVDKIVLIDSLGYNLNFVLKLLFRISRIKNILVFIKKTFSRTIVKGFVKSALYNESVITSRTINSYYYPLNTKGGLKSLVALCRNLSYYQFNKEEISSIEKPALIIWGENDSWVSLSNGHKFKKAIKNSKLVIIEKCGHGPQEEQPEKVCAAIKSFIEDGLKD